MDMEIMIKMDIIGIKRIKILIMVDSRNIKEVIVIDIILIVINNDCIYIHNLFN